jgi:two-component system, cell cycle sensor histidine kinase and response regulator CckA
MVGSLKILHLEDSEPDTELIKSKLEEEGLVCQVLRVDSSAGFVEALQSGGMDIILSDFSLPGFDGFSALAMAREECPEVPFVFVSGAIGEERAIESLKMGATDYVLKDRLARLGMVIRRALKEVRERSERLKAEKQLVFRNILLATQQEAGPDGIIVIGENRQLVSMNRRFVEMWGIPVEIAASKDINQIRSFIYAQITAPEVLCDSTFEHSGNPPESTHDEFLMKDGRVFERDSAPLIGPEKELLGRVCYFRDVTESRKVAEQQNQAKKMEALGNLAAGIAHDFNNLLAIILGNADVLKEEMSALGIKATGLIEIIQAGERAEEIIRNIQTFSRKSDLQRTLFHVRDVANEVLALTQHGLPSNITIQFQCLASRDLVFGDSSQIHRAIMNLCSNARRAMQAEGGVLRLVIDGPVNGSAISLPGSALVEGSYLRVTLSDTGQGMNKAILEHIFEPYFTTDRTGKGTGLGLAVVQGVISQHGGMITAESEVGKGAIFSMYLPLAPDTPGSETMSPTDRAIPTGAERILFVDDEPALAKLAGLTLSTLGYQTIVFTNSPEALQAFESGPEAFDLLIVDYSMPVMTGMELLQKAKAIRPTIKAILCTGYCNENIAETAESLGVTEILIKPVARHLLAQAIKRLFPGS